MALPFLPVGAALFCIQLDFFALNLALPTIARDLGRTSTDLHWLISGYMIALGALLLPAARAGDVIGRRKVLLAGVALFGLTSLICGLTSWVPLLIGSRIAQGVGAAMIFPTAFSLVTNATEEDVRPRITGALIGIADVGTALGPVVGGVVASTAGWRWVFLLNVPVAVFAFWRGLVLTESRDGAGPTTLRDLDWWGVVTVVGGLALVSIAIDDASSQGFLSFGTLGPLTGGLILLSAFIFAETRVDEPLVRPSLLRNRTFVVLALSSTIANVGACVYVVVATVELQNIRGLTAAAAGGVFFVSSMGMAITGPLAGKLSVKYAAGMVMAATLLLAVPSLVLLAVIGPLPFYAVALLLCGVATGTGYALGQIAVQTVLPPQRSAEGTGVVLTLMISVAGVAVVAAAAVIEVIGHDQPTRTGITTVLLSLSALLLAAGIATLAAELPRRKVRPVSEAA